MGTQMKAGQNTLPGYVYYMDKCSLYVTSEPRCIHNSNLCLFITETVFASLPQMERGVAKVIGGDPKGNNFLYTNGKSVIIRNIDVRSFFTGQTELTMVELYS